MGEHRQHRRLNSSAPEEPGAGEHAGRVAAGEILRRAVSAVAPGGRLLVVGHGAFPPGSSHDHDRAAPPLPTSGEVLASLDLPDGWTVETNESVDREVEWRDQGTVTLTDAVLRVLRMRSNDLDMV
ncbi:hypothetical protein DEA06_13550 [Microbacterium sp. Gd 4-13]|uniref:hypothetical protein n=1 Tax=Microbacterium sp. Gd 4-13 TaxID=2173179 RepID=UPI000D580EE1|nr:hypothetical protein [Microbacterium sp. Gd 4-13]PVW03531.1 hypothetical protein DEA06_13550 [Microbacterium sp. Gd 4-13]